MEERISKLIDSEWALFRAVNGGERVSCQNDRKTFVIMRSAQYRAWPPEALACYAADLERAVAAGRNIVREKYIRMMRSTAPEAYAPLAAELPPLSAEQERLTAEIWSHLAAQTERMRRAYPHVALGGRPLYAREETDGWASVETYETSELLTYSEATLRALLAHIETLEAQGLDFARQIQENTVRLLGFADLAAADRNMAGEAAATACGAERA